MQMRTPDHLPSGQARPHGEVAVVVLVILVSLGVVCWSLVATFGPPLGSIASLPSPPSLPTPVATVIPNGTQITVEPQQYTVYRYVNLSATNYLTGTFTAGQPACSGCPGPPWGGVFVMNSTDYEDFPTDAGNFSDIVGPAGSVVYASAGSIFSKLSPGASYVVFWNNFEGPGNPPENYTTVFTITTPFEIYPANDTSPSPPEGVLPIEVVEPVFVQLGGDAFTGQGVLHIDFALPVTYWSWNVFGSYKASNCGEPICMASVAIDNSFFGFEPTVFSTNPSESMSFNVTLPPGTYVLALVDPGWNVGCSENPNVGCPIVDVSITGTFARPL